MRESPAVDPEHDRPLIAIGRRGEDVQVEAVFVLGAAGGEAGDGVRRLGCGESRLLRGADTGPRLGSLRRSKSEQSARGRGIGDAVEGEVAFALEPFDSSVGRGDLWRVWVPRS